jgi:flagellar biosynthesis regulator FlbT
MLMAVRVCDYRSLLVSSVCLVRYTPVRTIVTAVLLMFITRPVDSDSRSASYEVFRRKLVILCARTRPETLSEARLIQPAFVGNTFVASLRPPT